ncbi:bifunctional adenosylcobinamide kinase/adenosylcobinamide-phosphate guanylyltransferase [Paenibacillus lentus]|uniref:Adenosylcobinamide kinase n=1 Tax=Paenibacillus lentus TaxID=1338368 RepID=A0A3S8RZ96_9BACL|nr:bifunctional adenosylcobinamide kinase/adenosylcobinamide-phosphate guanylyltransferase [Paenibacillus lentus]AZK48276.1 bifunctional adenosylcobinamide kinase/adenosylcobinamide-phosphate guanylyltransferase [Paenibacillus lentus]
MIVMVTGGARSGKSSFAERWCMKHAGRAYYIATAQAFDIEMEQRIALHRQGRETTDYSWETIEEPLQLGDLLTKLSDTGREAMGAAHSDPEVEPSPAVLIDCLTLWLSNVLLSVGEQTDGEAKAMEEIDRLMEAIASYNGTIVVVTNEVGSGIVPAYPLGRLYRDLAGVMNRRLATIAKQVFLVTAGIPIELKSREYKL